MRTNTDGICGEVPSPRPVETGTEHYYLDRLADFRRRCPDVPPPSYYAAYGDKCLHQFLATRPQLSARGQQWVDETLRGLQEMMEDRRRTDASGFASLEHDDDAFRCFAFATHSRAYHQAGVMDLGVRDLWKIVRTPDPSDVVSDDGVREMLRIVLGQEGGERSGMAFDPASPGAGALARIARLTRRLRSVATW